MGSLAISLTMYFQFIIIYFFFLLIINISILCSQFYSRFQHWLWFKNIFNFKMMILGSTITILILHLITLVLFVFENNQSGITTLKFSILSINFRIDHLSLNFVTLICFLFPIVIIMSDLNFSVQNYRFFFFLLCLEFIIYLFILVDDILIFYILYEFMVGLVFLILYATSNSRGSVEAALFFLGWALFGSIIVGAAIVYIITLTQTTDFSTVLTWKFTADEIYFLNFAFFLGFGSKLSIWPVWYWLPRAHVEVSAAFSIFLSCILIKVCLYGYMRSIWWLHNDIVIIPFIFFLIICVLDVTCRLIVQVDLKAVIAYGSVLHVNLLMLMILIDGPYLNMGLILYIWGHSYATAGLFFATNLIEKCYSSRSTFEISGIYNSNPAVAITTIFAVITFLEFPLTFFFWGEFWLWSVLLSSLPATIIIIMFISTVVYVIVFFRIWWGVIFGASSYLAYYPQTTLSRNDIFLFFYIIFIQYIWGVQPNIFYIFVMS